MIQSKDNTKVSSLYGELLDRLYVANRMLEDHCLAHQAAKFDAKTFRLMKASSDKLIEAYQRIAKAMVAEDTKKTKFLKLAKQISNQLDSIQYRHGDVSDIGNEIGIAMGEHLKTDTDVSDFISGLTHGISLKNNTHS